MADSANYLHPRFNYFEAPIIQTSIKDQRLVEIPPLNALQHNAPFEFLTMGGEGESQYVDLMTSFFEFKIRFVTQDNKAPDDDEGISCIQNLAHSMFSRIDLSLNDKLINDPNHLYPYRAYFKDLFTASSDTESNLLEVQGWCDRDEAGEEEMSNYEIASSDEDSCGSKRAKARHDWIGTGQSITLIMKPHLDLFENSKFILPGIKIRIKFTPNHPNFVIKRGSGSSTYKFDIQEARFHCRFVQASSPHDLSIIDSLKTLGCIRMRFNRIMLKQMHIPQGCTNANLDNIYFGAIPKRITFAMVSDAAFAGDHKQNPLNFKPFGLSYLAVYVNGKTYPNPPFQPTWNDRGYIREYFLSLDAMNKTFKSNTNCFSLDEFESGYTIFAFDLTAHRNSENITSDQGTGNVRIVVRFRQPLDNAVAAIIQAEYDATIEIDQFKNITTNF